nr:hypothetical protein [Tanacetum cinerariifolium]
MDGLDDMLENGPCEDSLSAIATKLGTLLMLDSYISDMCMQSWGRVFGDYDSEDEVASDDNDIARSMASERVDFGTQSLLKQRRDSYGNDDYDDDPYDDDMYEGAGEKKTVKKPSQTSRGVSVGPKMVFKPQKEYRSVSKKPTPSSNGNKKKGVEPTIEVSNSNPFEVLNSIDNDEELGINGGTTNLVNNGATSSGSSFINVDDNSTGTTPIIDKIGKFE